MMLLIFGMGNAKLNTRIATFSLPAGYACPFALKCLSKFDRKRNKIVDGPECEVRCFSASAERYPAVRDARWYNFDLLCNARTCAKMVRLIQRSLPKLIKYVRIHVSGDFFNFTYFKAWVQVARNNPDVIFYAYTKALPYWTKSIYQMPHNLRLVASKGGTDDDLIETYDLPSVEVVYSVEEAIEKGLELDHDDSHAIEATHDFALLIHGAQPAGSFAARQWERIRKTVGGYNNSRKRLTTVLA
jgi:hypothetical protein